ncbi:MAG: glycerophosphodiester phosphodiesterase family protein, partial [Betaproteobacteria bacterium]
FGTSIRTAGGFAWAAGFDNKRVTPRGLARAHSLGLKKLVYTVNEPLRLRELEAFGVEGVFTDCPDLARATLARRPD